MAQNLVGGLVEYSNIIFENQLDLENNYNYNVFNLFNLKGFTDQQLLELIENRLNIDLNNEEGLQKMQIFYNLAITIYTNELLIDLKSPFKNYYFKNKKAIISFIKNTYTCKNGERRQIYCDLIKLMYGSSMVENNQQLKEAKDDADKFVNDHILTAQNKFCNIDYASLMSNKFGKSYRETKGLYKLGLPSGGEKRIPFTLMYRGKSKEKIVLKLLYNEDGNSDITDNIGFEFEIGKKEDSIYFLETIYFIYKKSNHYLEGIDFLQKPSFYTEEELVLHYKNENLSLEFRQYLKNNLVTKKKSTGTNKYKDCKFKGPISIRNHHNNNVEGRVTIKGNKNQSGLSNSDIVDGRKKVLAIIGLRGWVSHSYIERVVKYIVSKDGVEKNENHIRGYLLSNLIIVANRKNRKIYSTISRFEDIINNSNNYPESIKKSLKRYAPGILESIEKVKKDTLHIV